MKMFTRALTPIVRAQSSTVVSRAALSSDALRRTSLYDFHVSKGGKMVPFAGFEMPVQYTDLSIRDSHLHTRKDASLFDVSHMLQMEIHGKDRIRFFESLVVADVAGLGDHCGSLTVYTTPSGGIIDDLIVTRKPETLYVVSNAGRIKEDLEHINEQQERFRKANPNADLTLNLLSGLSLLALQGPSAAAALQGLVKTDLSKLKFMNGIDTQLNGVPVRVTRCGYTGEDGFEIAMPNEKAAELAEALLQDSRVKLAGLGARDSLRLEAGLCLYGNDIDTTTSPIEAGLAWTVAKRRRAAADFPGAEVILRQLKEKPTRRRVGLVGVGACPPVRSHSKIIVDGAEVGEVTSGCPAPSLPGKNIAMGYVPTAQSKVGTRVQCDIRGKQFEYEVTKMPFLQTRYFV